MENILPKHRTLSCRAEISTNVIMEDMYCCGEFRIDKLYSFWFNKQNQKAKERGEEEEEDDDDEETKLGLRIRVCGGSGLGLRDGSQDPRR